MSTLYSLKPRFQDALRPAVRFMVSRGIVANHVTLGAAAMSIAFGLAMLVWPDAAWLFLLLPVVLLLRMALNAIDGMLAREHGQISDMGFYINEIGDIVSDLALILPFACIAPFQPWSVFALATGTVAAEYAGILGHTVGAGRLQAGPFGKSDRALALGLLGLLIGTGLELPAIHIWIFPLFAALAFLTAANRTRLGLAQARTINLSQGDER